MLEEGIRLPRTRVWSAVQLLLRASVRPLTISIRRRGQGHHLLVARPCKSRQVRMVEPGHFPLCRPCKDTCGINSSRHAVLARQPFRTRSTHDPDKLLHRLGAAPIAIKRHGEQFCGSEPVPEGPAHAPPLVTGGSPALVLTRHLLSSGITDPPTSPRVGVREVCLDLQEDVPWRRTGVLCRPAVLRHAPSKHPISSHYLLLCPCSANTPHAGQ